MKKAYNRVDWAFLKDTLRLIKIHELFITWITTLYKDLSAQISSTEIFLTPSPYNRDFVKATQCPLSSSILHL
ncbi:hypothetical protein DSO57_1001626, partial [Entomophthora muscae]